MRSNQTNPQSGHLKLFVYGTLKRGYWNHDRFCHGAVSIEKATIRGRLYQLPSGIPILRVPDTDILATGTACPVSDTTLQEHYASEVISLDNVDGGSWDIVRGELLVFSNPRLSLPPIDRLEGYIPNNPACLYIRVLVRVCLNKQVTAAWCYVSRGQLPDNVKQMGKLEWMLSN